MLLFSSPLQKRIQTVQELRNTYKLINTETEEDLRWKIIEHRSISNFNDAMQNVWKIGVLHTKAENRIL